MTAVGDPVTGPGATQEPYGEATASSPQADRSGTEVADERNRSPWLRYGWLLAGAWVFFLGFPLQAAVQSDHSPAVRALGVGLVISFGLVYLRAFHSMPMWVGPLVRHRAPWGGLLVLATIMGALVPIIGPGAIGLTPFLVAYGSFLLPQPWPLVTFTLGAGTALVVAGLTRDWSLPVTLLPLSFAILVSAIVTRSLIQRDARRDVLERESLVVAERDRMARDVHDLLGHSLTVIHLKAQLAVKLMDEDPDRAREELGAISSISQEALAGVRQTVSDRRSGGFPQSVDEFVSALEGSGIRTSVVGDPHQVTGIIVLPLAFVMRELSTNILRHAHAENCSVEIEERLVRVGDDGDGFEESREGTGLRGMRERLALAGGSLRSGVSSLGGAQVEVTW